MTIHQFSSEKGISSSKIIKILGLSENSLFKELTEEEIIKICEHRIKEKKTAKRKKNGLVKPNPWNMNNYKYTYVRIISTPNK